MGSKEFEEMPPYKPLQILGIIFQNSSTNMHSTERDCKWELPDFSVFANEICIILLFS